MELWEKVIEAFPEIQATDDFSRLGIYLQDDGEGAYIAKWEYKSKLPSSLESYLKA